MAERVPFRLDRRNPDVLTCIANLSNDEVFTPPSFAKQMLDSLQDAWAEANDGANIWADSTVTFLDPCTKSGVFLREIVERLTTGLESQIPDLQTRVDHILTKQVFGIATTELTSLIARRSVYCSKFANGKHSVASTFQSEAGNIWFEPLEHSWVGGKEKVQTADAQGNPITKTLDGKCKYCGASQKTLDREGGSESHAYGFIHTDNVQSLIAKLFGEEMQFDVVIGNPPYQLNDGGGPGTSASPIYNKFIEQAKNLNPRLLCMVVPARWYSGGKGLDAFRAAMLGDRRIRFLADFPDSREAFQGVDVAGGVCFFLWNRDEVGVCVVETRVNGLVVRSERLLDQYETFVRDNRALAVVERVLSFGGSSFADLVSSRKPFGLESAEKGDKGGDLYLFASGEDGRIASQKVLSGHDLIDKWKVLVSKTSSEHAGQTDKNGSKRVLSRIEIMPPGSVCTESYLVVGPFESEAEAINASQYMRTKFFRFLLSAKLMTQNISKRMFEFVPIVPFTEPISDAHLMVKYQLTTDEVSWVETLIRSMDFSDE
jgi:hypothetical protein